jgi:hypothetical protein
LRILKALAVSLVGIITAYAGVVTILAYHGIKATDIKMPLSPPHWFSLATGLLLLVFSFSISGYYLWQTLVVNRKQKQAMFKREQEWEQRAADLVKQGEEKLATAHEAHQKEIDSLKKAPEPQQRPSKLTIHSANYAAIEGGGKTYDVTEFMQQIIAGDSLVLDIENHNFVADGKNFVPYDPRVDKKKRLQVEYSYDGEPAITIERKEHFRLVLPQDSEIEWLASASRKLATEDAEKICDRLHVCGTRAEFHFQPGLDPHVDIFVEFMNGSVFQVVSFGEVEGYARYGNSPLAAAPRMEADAKYDIGSPLITVKHGGTASLIIRQPLTEAMADRMVAEQSRGIPLTFNGVFVLFKILGGFGVPVQSFGWYGIPSITIREATRITE